jgi:hypothetical protein
MVPRESDRDGRPHQPGEATHLPRSALTDVRHSAACRGAATTASADERVSHNWHFRSAMRQPTAAESEPHVSGCRPADCESAGQARSPLVGQAELIAFRILQNSPRVELTDHRRALCGQPIDLRIAVGNLDV